MEELLLLGFLRREQAHGYRLNEFIVREMTACTDIKKPTAYFLLDKMAKRERATSPTPQEQKASDAIAYADKDRHEQDESRRQADAPVAEIGKVVEGVSSSADQKIAANSAPSASAPAPIQAPDGAAAGGTITPSLLSGTLIV